MSKLGKLGNDLYNGERSIDFIGRKWTWYAISAVFLVVAASGLLFKGLNFGIEFTGGSQYTINLPADRANQDTADELRKVVAGTGIADASAPVVTTQGDQAIVVQTQARTTAESDEVAGASVDATGIDPADDLSREEIGPSWGAEVAEQSSIGLAVFLVLVMLFIWAYCREWKMSVGAMVALIHDVTITAGIYALSGFQVTPATVTAVLTQRIRPDAEEEFHRVQARMLRAMEQFEGFLRSDLLPPVPGVQEDHVIVFSFASKAHLDRWLESDERRQLLTDLAPLIEGERTLNVVGGFAGWFPAPGLPQPVRWKQAVAVLLALFPTTLTLGFLQRWLVPDIPWTAALFVSNVLGVSVLTWLLMPLVTRWLGGWLRR
jgi:antibiotic biosynthesis monooxygenase (ABM) superfamily enzyme